MQIVDGIQKKLAIIEEIKAVIEKYKLNPTFNNKFEMDYLKKEHQREIPKEFCSNIVV
jgi:hypothetical protein